MLIPAISHRATLLRRHPKAVVPRAEVPPARRRTNARWSHQQQLARRATQGVAARATTEARNSMPPQEWDAFWSAVECCMLLQGSGAGVAAPACVNVPALSEQPSASKRGRTNRAASALAACVATAALARIARTSPSLAAKGSRSRRACGARALTRRKTTPAEASPPTTRSTTIPSSCRCSATPRTACRSAPVPLDSCLPSRRRLSSPRTATRRPSFDLDVLGGKRPIATASKSGLSWLSKAACNSEGAAATPALGKQSSADCSMLQATRRRLQALREEAEAASGPRGLKRVRSELCEDDVFRPSSSMSMGYSTADEYEAEDIEPADDYDNASQQSSTEAGDAPEVDSDCSAADARSTDALLVAAFAMASGPAHVPPPVQTAVVAARAAAPIAARAVAAAPRRRLRRRRPVASAGPVLGPRSGPVLAATVVPRP